MCKRKYFCRSTTFIQLFGRNTNYSDMVHKPRWCYKYIQITYNLISYRIRINPNKFSLLIKCQWQHTINTLKRSWNLSNLFLNLICTHWWYLYESCLYNVQYNMCDVLLFHFLCLCWDISATKIDYTHVTFNLTRPTN